MILRPVHLFFALLTFLFSGCAGEHHIKYLKLAHGLDNTHPVHKAMEFMAQRVAEKSDGKLQIEIYPSSQLGTERQCLELLQIGSLAMTKVSAAVLENFAPEIQVFCLPYVFTDREQMFHVQDSELGKELLLSGEKYWLRGLTYFDAGSRSFYSKSPIRTPEDLSNKKIRVQESATAMEMVRALGGAPTPISWGELYTALQQGVVDGAENNPPSFYSSRHYEVCKYYTLNEHTAIPDLLLIGTVAWNGLTAEEQQWLQSAADEATVYERTLWAKSEAEALAAVEKAGVEIIHPDKQLFREKTSAMRAQYEKDPVMGPLIKRIEAIQ